MSTLVALFRAVDVGGRATIAMGDLCAMAAQLDLGAPRTLLQSGNLIFTSDTNADALEPRLETAAKAAFGLDTSILVRSAEAWAKIVEACPYPEHARSDPSHLLVMPLRESPTAQNEADLRRAIIGREGFELRDKTAYITYPDGIGRSKLTASLVERRLRTIGTARNWNTALKIAAALAS